METATFAGGCFWCTEAIFKRLKGIESVLPGYSGGDLVSPTYEQVSGGDTGHAEAIQIEFSPNVISFKTLLEIFFYTHDPTTPNQQGNDIGPQYRSVIFYHSEAQKKEAEDLIHDLEGEKIYGKPIITTVEPFELFYFAEDYHKNYFDRNQNAPYCTYVIGPKISKLLKKYGNEIKEEFKEN